MYVEPLYGRQRLRGLDFVREMDWQSSRLKLRDDLEVRIFCSWALDYGEPLITDMASNMP